MSFPLYRHRSEEWPTLFFVIDIFVILSVYWPLALPLEASASAATTVEVPTISTSLPRHLSPIAQFAGAQVQLFLFFFLPLYLSADWLFTNYQMPPPR